MQKFNAQITGRTDIESPEELARVYYRVDELKDTSGITVSSIEATKEHFEITLIQEGLEDDSQAATKVVLIVHRIGQMWTVTEIQTNWKCWDDRGHTS